jgi:hypothetical protein
MTIWMPPETIAKVMCRWRWLTLLGLTLLVIGFWHPHCLGFASGLILLSFGVIALTFRLKYREKGIWMLSALSLITYIPFSVMLEFDYWHRNHNPQQGMTLLVLQIFDSALATYAAFQLVRFLASITRFNWKISREDGNHPTRQR